MLEPVDLIGRRIDALERSYFGKIPDYDQYLEPGVITTKLDNISVKMGEIDHQIPAMRASHTLLLKLKPVILERKSKLSSLLQKIDSIVANKATISSYIEDLQNIERLSYAVNGDHFKAAESLAGQMEYLEQLLNPLLLESRQQTKEIDELLEYYEKSMAAVSSVCAAWEEKLEAAENSDKNT